ncbi:hypothetical protein [[Flexibacter] sp. ATCC 35208]|uniref:hypothetical protein n=1 Tax=[Flexibacter] sp. ATCC 35208 TaxID=1936242 RepID=UPI0009D158DF|nr:hypothetical protein [[Flexibacter] sp. ATCC 35208]OMP76684.1 hypothetical protein BW716_23730 [[Flexibacter] sp. ATCC 35208]
MTRWERTTLTFISQTSDWDRNRDATSFLPFSISLLRELFGAYISLQLDFEDTYTAKVKAASPSYLNDLILNPGPLTALLEQHHYKTIYWSQIPEKNAFDDLLQALSSAVILPVTEPGVNAIILFGWSEPQTFDASARECLEIIRCRFKEILQQSHNQHIVNITVSRFTAIMHTIPQALVFISNDGHSGWVNTAAASLLDLDRSGEQPPHVLSLVMGKLINSAENKEVINKEALLLFTSPDSKMKDMRWEIPGNTLSVSCMPVDGIGKLWEFKRII